MCDVLDENFEAIFDRVKCSIDKSSFISIDAEYTGISLGPNNQPSLFDGSEERYKKLLERASKFILCQIGVSAFIFDENENRYEAHTYNFYIFPKAFGFDEDCFMSQSGSLQFLCQYGFDFNKFVYGGISYMNQLQELEFRNRFENGTFMKYVRDTDRNLIQDYYSQVFDWLAKDDENEMEIVLPVRDVRLDEYILQAYLREEFKNIWTSEIDRNNISLKKVNKVERNELETNDDLMKKIELRHVGFSLVFRLLVNSKKPIVGHNLLLDLMFMYSKFHKPLPKSCAKFKEELRRLFPLIFDTKYMGLETKFITKKDNFIGSTMLKCLYDSLSSHKGCFSSLYSPAIIHAPEFTPYFVGEINLHVAGFDAYITGYVFLRLAHLITTKHRSTENYILRPFKFREYLRKLDTYQNKLNISLANILCLNIEGKDKLRKRPEYLVVEIRNQNKHFNRTEVAQALSSFCFVDVCELRSNQMLVAASSYQGAREILKDFANHKEWKICYYNVLRHSKRTRGFIWTGVILSGVASCLLLAFAFKK